MATTFTNLLFHIVFSTKDRMPAIHDALREPLYEYIGGIIRGEGGTLRQIGGVPDLMGIVIHGYAAANVQDPFGHVWTIATHVEDIAPEEMRKRAEEAMKHS